MLEVNVASWTHGIKVATNLEGAECSTIVPERKMVRVRGVDPHKEFNRLQSLLPKDLTLYGELAAIDAALPCLRGLFSPHEERSRAAPEGGAQPGDGVRAAHELQSPVVERFQDEPEAEVRPVDRR
jgi:hypothetical protein